MSFCNWGFCDLSVNKNLDFTCLKLIENFGYTTVAINTHVEEINDEPKKKKKKGEVKEKQDSFPAPVDIGKDIVDQTKVKILQRITLEFSDSSISHKITQSENLKKFDIIAVLPKTLAAFQYACASMDVDIITFEPECRLPFRVNRKLYSQAIDRGIFFELMYGAAIKDSTSRKNIISTAHLYHAVGKSKNLIITSSADNVLHLRGVYDIINLGLLFGLNNNQSLETVRDNPRKVILKAEGRRSGKLYVGIDKVYEENKTS